MCEISRTLDRTHESGAKGSSTKSYTHQLHQWQLYRRRYQQRLPSPASSAPARGSCLAGWLRTRRTRSFGMSPCYTLVYNGSAAHAIHIPNRAITPPLPLPLYIHSHFAPSSRVRKVTYKVFRQQGHTAVLMRSKNKK